MSARVVAWAAEKGYSQLPEHLDAFKRKVQANAYTYADWDSAFMEAIREDWARLRGKAQIGGAVPVSDSRPQWAINAGFTNRWEAENEGCYERNAHLFHDGKRTEAA
ncbi:hypothetical protein G7048_19235 [Diaphorobacter sp. HDW4B]|uniref:hypothetical protein n=1 Tax=Diaphorobacter sp. HDW4B TaxID=2714925 RepID=UPI0014079B86|nr:hypothetical protein [Diaphorobacter sp. HDW4B]QIL72300.1 hypothetical protein G7048_19235 [Diaphorobacter sp. HDW4B]